MTTQQQTDADLIREANETAAAMRAFGLTAVAATLRRAAARLAELTQPAPLADAATQRMVHDFPALSAFHEKHALGPMRAPSCLCCGKVPDEVAVSHMELPGIIICKTCHTKAITQPAPQPHIHEVLYETVKHRHEAIYETIIQWDIGGGKRSRRELTRRIERLLFAPEQPAPQPDPVVWECKAGGLKPLTQRLYDAQPDNIKRHYTRIEQPAPLALSKEDAMVWDSRVQAAQVTTAKSCIDEAILAVDALLRKRVTPLTGEQMADGARAELWAGASQAEAAAFYKGARFAEAAHGIGGEA